MKVAVSPSPGPLGRWRVAVVDESVLPLQQTGNKNSNDNVNAYNRAHRLWGVGDAKGRGVESYFLLGRRCEPRCSWQPVSTGRSG